MCRIVRLRSLSSKYEGSLAVKKGGISWERRRPAFAFAVVRLLVTSYINLNVLEFTHLNCVAQSA